MRGASIIRCETCTFDNDANLHHCLVCNSVLEKNDDITCLKCTYSNSIGNNMCEMCGAALQYKRRKGFDSLQTLDDSPIMQEEYASGSSTAHVQTLKDSSIMQEEYTSGSSTAQMSDFVSDAAIEGILELLKMRLSDQKNISNFKLVSPLTFISQKLSEAGKKWSCGYRNIQILCLSLMKVPIYRQRLFGGTGSVPDVYGIQSWIERAWNDGFDVDAKIQLGGSLLGTDTWIGASEAAALLRYFGIRAVILDFVAPGSTVSVDENYNGKSKSFETPNAANISKWIEGYFRVTRQLTIDNKSQFVPPIFFQQDGHSRSVVGYETYNDKKSLLIFDPASDGIKLKENLISNHHWQVMVKRGLHTITRGQYQMVYISGESIMSKEERERSKIFKANMYNNFNNMDFNNTLLGVDICDINVSQHKS